MTTKRTRDELKELFKQGSKPSQDDFSDLIDSFVNLSDDGLEKPWENDPLRIQAQGNEKNILDIYDDTERLLRLSLRSADKKRLGLSLQSRNDRALFLDGADGKLGLGTDNPKARLHIKQTKSDDALRIDCEAKDSAPLVVKADGKVGVGVANPKAKLAVNGGVHIGGDSDPGDKNLLVDGTLSLSSGHIIHNKAHGVINWGDGDKGNLYFRTLEKKGDISKYTQRMIILNSGNVGVGVATPRAKLAVNGGVHVGGGSDPGDNNLLVDGKLFVTSGHLVYNNFHGVINWGDGNKGNLYFRALEKKGDISKYKERMRILNNGAVGVGFGNPKAKLAVNGGVHVGGDSDPGDKNLLVDGKVGIGAPDPKIHLAIGGDGGLNRETDGSVTVYTNNKERVRAQADGHVLIGSDDQHGTLQIINRHQDSGGGSLILGNKDHNSNLRLGYNKDYSWIQSHGAKPLRINELGNNVIINKNRGNVGIGFDNPKARLAVNGGVHVGGDSDPGDNNLLVDGKLWVTSGNLVYNNKNGIIHWGDNNEGNLYFRALEKKGNISSYEERMIILNNGNVGVGFENPQARLAVNGGVHVGGDSDPGDKNLLVDGLIQATTVRASNPMAHRMYPDDPVVYQDIFEAKDKKAILKLNRPSYNDTSYGAKRPWNLRKIIKYGKDQEKDGDGALVIIPDNYDTVWARVLGERWSIIKAYFEDGGKEQVGYWAGGFRNANCYCPDGSLADSYRGGVESKGIFYAEHQWLPIPAGRSGRLALISKKGTTNHFWLSGLAFSKNPWKHAALSGRGYHLGLNGSDKVAYHNKDTWNNDVMARLRGGRKWSLKVPVVPSSRDKLLYLVEHNNNWNGCMHTGVKVNGVQIERFLSTYDNPFARHWNSKVYNRYIAARIPGELIKHDQRYLDVEIDMSKQQKHDIAVSYWDICFREIGTHDLDIPDPAAPAIVIPKPPFIHPEPPDDRPRPPIIKPRPPVIKPRPPVIKPKPPVVKPRPPVIKPKPPVVKPKPPVVKPKPPVIKPKPPVIKPRPPVVKPRPPVVKPKPRRPGRPSLVKPAPRRPARPSVVKPAPGKPKTAASAAKKIRPSLGGFRPSVSAKKGAKLSPSAFRLGKRK